MALLGLSALLFLSIDQHGLPHGGLEWPVFLSPILTFAVAAMAFSDVLRCTVIATGEDSLNGETEKSAIQVVTAIGFFVAFLLCLMLMSFEGWLRHLIWLASLFALFMMWDLLMLQWVSNKAHRTQIRSGHRLVNRPTLCAILIIAVFLTLYTLIGSTLTDSGVATTGEMKALANQDNAKQQSTIQSPQEIFVAGLVCFHLVVAACGYFATFFSEPPAACGSRWYRVGHVMFAWVPKGPCETTDAGARQQDNAAGDNRPQTAGKPEGSD